MYAKEQILDVIRELTAGTGHAKNPIESEIVRRSKTNLVTLLSILPELDIVDISKIKNTECVKEPIFRDPALDIVSDEIDYDIIFYTDKTELVIVRDSYKVQEYGGISQIQTTEPILTVTSPVVNIDDFATLNGLHNSSVLNDVLNLKYIDAEVFLDSFKLPTTAFPSSVPYSFSVDCDPYKGFNINIDDDIRSYRDIVSFNIDVFEDEIFFAPTSWISRNNTFENETAILSDKDAVVFLREILTNPSMKVKKGSVLMTAGTGINYAFF